MRYYKPYTITLLEFKHDVYAGTDIPSNFSSKIHLQRPRPRRGPRRADPHEQPLRYGGETLYQASFEQGDKVSILQVVRNPAAITPYVACMPGGGGLIAQFLTHLFGFARKARATRARPLRSVPARRPQTLVSTGSGPRKESSMKKWMPWISAAIFAAWFLSGAQAPKPADGFDVAAFGRLPVLLNGRIQPLDSVARNSLLSISGRFHLSACPTAAAFPPREWLLETMTKPDSGRSTESLPRPASRPGRLARRTKSRACQYYSFNDLTNQFESLQDQAANDLGGRKAKGEDAEKERDAYQRT